MKRFLKYSVIVLLLLCVFLPGHFAHASAYTDCVDKADAGNNFYKDFAACSNLPGAPNLQSGIDQSAGANAPKCGVNPFSGACLAAAGAGIAYLILGAMSWLLWLAGTGLDYVLNYTILQMSTNISGMTGINIVWKVIRDLANIAFIFILLYEAILLIISKSSTEKIKGIVAGIIITALLINFSLFFTKIVIDASNVVTVGFYQSIIGAGQSTTIATGGINGNTATISKGISGAFVNDLHVVEFFTAQDPTKLNTTTGQDNKSLIMIGLGGSVLFLVLAFVFFAVSIMYLMRYIVLVVLLMSAPLGYLGIGLPLLKGTQSSWWSTLLGQCIFAPLWMFCCWAILTLVGSPGFLTLTGGATQTGLSSGGAMSQLFSGNGGAAAPAGIPLLINFALVIGLVIGSLTLAKQYAGQGSGMISSWTGKATAFAGGAIMGTAAGAAASAGRNTFGRAGNAIANSEALKERAAKGGLLGIGAKGLMKAGEGTSKKTFDARASTSLAAITGATGVGIGKAGGKGGFQQGLKDRTKAEEDFAKKLKSSDVEYEKAKEKDNEIKAAQAELKNSKFVAEEEARKKAGLNSEDYKNSDLYKKAEAEKVANEATGTKIVTEEEKQTKLDAELKEIEKSKTSASYLVDQQKRKEIDDSIVAKKQEIENQKTVIAKLNENVEKNSVATKERQIYENGWKSKEMKDLEVIAKQEAENEKALNEVWNERKRKYANVVENKWIKKTAMLVAGGAAGAVVGGLTAGPVGLVTGAVAGATAARNTTKSENRDIARKIRNEIGKKKEMTAKERAKWEKIRNNPESTPEQIKEATEKLGYREEDLKEDES